MIKSMGSENRMSSKPVLPQTICMTLSKLLFIYVTQFSNLQSGNNNNTHLLYGINMVIHVRNLEQCLAQNKYSINISYPSM